MIRFYPAFCVAGAALLVAGCRGPNRAEFDSGVVDAVTADLTTPDVPTDHMPPTNDLSAIDGDMDSGIVVDVPGTNDVLGDLAVTDAADVADVTDVIDVTDVQNLPSCDAASATDSAVTDGAVGPSLLGTCAVNNGGCSTFATCRMTSACSRQCVCIPGLTIQADGTSCAGLLLVSKPGPGGTNTDFSSGAPHVAQTGRYVAFTSAGSMGMDFSRCFLTDVVTGAVQRISEGAMGQLPDAHCYLPRVSNDGRRVAFVVGSRLPGDMVPPALATAWPYYRDGAAMPQRLQIFNRMNVVDANGEGIARFDMTRDGQRFSLTTRSSLDPTAATGGEYNAYNGSIPLVLGTEPTLESTSTNPPHPSVDPLTGGNGGVGTFSADGNSMAFEHPLTLAPEDVHRGRDVFVRYFGGGGRRTQAASITAPDGDHTRGSGLCGISANGDVVAFNSNAVGLVGGALVERFFLSILSGGRRQVQPIGVDVLLTDNACSMTDDARLIAVPQGGAFNIPGEPPDTNGIADLYLFDISTLPARPRTRITLRGDGTEPRMPNVGRFTARMSGDGNSVVFQTTQALLPTDTNDLSDVYLRVFR